MQFFASLRLCVFAFRRPSLLDSGGGGARLWTKPMAGIFSKSFRGWCALSLSRGCGRAKESMNKTLLALVLGWIGFSCGVCFGQPVGTLLWSYNAGSDIATSPAIAPDGTIYIGTGNGLFAITNAGSNKWIFPMWVGSSAAIASDGTVYVNSRDGKLCAVNPDGTQKWSYSTGGGIGSPAIGSDNTIYISADFGLQAISPFGTNKWKSAIGDSGVSSPVIGPYGTIYIMG
jgi:outer membrane protein assembly factor BamB